MKCTSIEYVENQSMLYDLEIDGGENNYIADGVVVHNTNCSVTCLVSIGGSMRDNIDQWIPTTSGWVTVGSKGLSAQGLFFKNNEANVNNLYLNGTRKFHHAISDWAFQQYLTGEGPNCITVVGEVFGGSVQSGFDYGLKAPEFRAFDVYVGYRGQGRYLDDDELDTFCALTSIPRVPLVYRGPYSKALAEKLANDPETALPGVKHVREGVVIKPCKERRDSKLGRVVVKTRSIAYMSRKGDQTDWN